MSFNVNTDDFGTTTVSIEGKNHPDFDFNRWNLRRDGNSVDVEFYIRDELKQVIVNFTEKEETKRLYVKDYL